ncbi:Uma2 family endonuclease [Kineococcus gypseus]|uniref:Uma2 family endonuclease n=1 Tax=Kineococcus gypseus TaxID=1637102 RepID=UPI003D7E5490
MAAEVQEGARGVPMSWEDYRALGDDVRGEYVDGAFLPRGVVTGRHQRLIVRLANLLDRDGRQVFHEWGWKPGADKYEPDVVVIDAAAEVDEGAQYWDGPVLLCVEVLSPSNQSKDWVRNTARYARHGCPEYWIVSPWDHTVYVHRLVDGAYELDRALSAGTHELERWGVVLDVGALFA